MHERTLFYSWQSDSDPWGNRNFIEELLKKTVTKRNRALSRAERIPWKIRQAARGVAGTPDIPSAIFQAIDESQAFVADVTIINPDSTDRLTPNPNVMIELGYAVSRLSWSRLICVANTAHGSLEKMPFDIKTRSIVPYALRRADSKASVRPNLGVQLLGKLIEFEEQSMRHSDQARRDSRVAGLIDESLGTLRVGLRMFLEEHLEGAERDRTLEILFRTGKGDPGPEESQHAVKLVMSLVTEHGLICGMDDTPPGNTIGLLAHGLRHCNEILRDALSIFGATASADLAEAMFIMHRKCVNNSRTIDTLMEPTSEQGAARQAQDFFESLILEIMRAKDVALTYAIPAEPKAADEE